MYELLILIKPFSKMEFKHDKFPQWRTIPYEEVCAWFLNVGRSTKRGKSDFKMTYMYSGEGASCRTTGNTNHTDMIAVH